MQAGAERALNRLMTALAGASVLFGQGMLETGLTFDIPTLLVDDEIIDYVLRMLAGFKVDATTLSTDLIKEVGPFGTYLAEMNTFEHLGDLSTYNLMNRRNYDMWAASGKPDLYGQARERAKEILATHKQKNPLSPEQVKAIRDVLVDAEGELGVADFWKGKEETRFSDNALYLGIPTRTGSHGPSGGASGPRRSRKDTRRVFLSSSWGKRAGAQNGLSSFPPLCGKNDALPPNLLPCTTGRTFPRKTAPYPPRSTVP